MFSPTLFIRLVKRWRSTQPVLPYARGISVTDMVFMKTGIVWQRRSPQDEQTKSNFHQAADAETDLLLCCDRG
jgi:hypothetical protein